MAYKTPCKSELCAEYKLFPPSARCELDTDEVVPVLLAGPAAHLSHTAAHRGPRSLDASSTSGLHWNDTRDVLVELPAFGRRLVLHLTRDTSFLWRDFVVEERRRGEGAEVRRLPREELCFYSGSVLNQTGSVASLSTCGGLVSSVCSCWSLVQPKCTSSFPLCQG